ncbi:PAS domain-containing sensor histidine kinase [Hymenobacter psychrotolerans]|uniref:histidine kinase n=1 Tax=Hymenobacter psychrotolerans DSM 18569 TaxID=1121959 RepID=A0A1M6PLI8_9BACT|nr:ATP-binding protein [Hymenobacter psychrotolerans]SHK08785.1 two-component system, OmpR family, sensor histidine kinase VicK [Hymenobacter psychrotolerans DSM 18569]
MVDFVALFRPLAERSQLLYYIYHLETRRFLYVSPAYETITSRPAAAVNDDLPDLLALVHPDDKAYADGCLRHLLRGSFLEDVELRLLHPDGRIQWLCCTAARVSEADGRTYLSGTIQDTTSAREYRENADRFNKKKNATLEILSHDLAGPFVMMQQLAEFVGEKVVPLQDEMLDGMLRVMKNTCQDSVTLIRDFVDNEFMESANVDLKIERVDLVAELREVLEEYQRSEVNLAKNFLFRPASPRIYVELDNNKVMQVINNLVSNAIKFTPDGGRIEVSVAEEPSRVLITVADSGIGIPEHLMPVLFERFTPARRPGLRGEKTTGLGMSIIKSIVELHKGRIQCQSVENQGTTFTIELPRGEPA